MGPESSRFKSQLICPVFWEGILVLSGVGGVASVHSCPRDVIQRPRGSKEPTQFSFSAI